MNFDDYFDADNVPLILLGIIGGVAGCVLLLVEALGGELWASISLVAWFVIMEVVYWFFMDVGGYRFTRDLKTLIGKVQSFVVSFYVLALVGMTYGIWLLVSEYWRQVVYAAGISVLIGGGFALFVWGNSLKYRQKSGKRRRY